MERFEKFGLKNDEAEGELFNKMLVGGLSGFGAERLPLRCIGVMLCGTAPAKKAKRTSR